MDPTSTLTALSIPKKRILLVDDDPFLTAILRLNLQENESYEVREENNSLRALDTIRDYLPDLVLLDVMMPDLDGADVIYRMKSDQRLKQIAVVFHTATVRRTELDAHSTLISGYPFLSKPAATSKVIEAIEKHLPQ